MIRAIKSLLVALALSGTFSLEAAEMGKGFATPEQAVSALQSAAAAKSPSELRDIFGPAGEVLENPDRIQATNELNRFLDAMNTTNRIIRESETNCVLEVGTNLWPFPVPIIQQNGRWFFDTEAGKEELLNRRIGNDELSVLGALRAYVDAQREYASRDRVGNDVLQYAQRLASTPGKKDGLYWPTELDGETSPLGPMVADAQGEGYKVQQQGQSATRVPFHGYYFKILTRQGKDASGGEYSYVINGNMIGGFAMVAWPAEYGVTGVMTFIVNQRGRVYQKDLGPDTTKIASSMNAYDPGPGWSISPD